MVALGWPDRHALLVCSAREIYKCDTRDNGGLEELKMVAFRGLLVIMFAVLAAYTLVTIANHGMGLLPVFFGDMAKMAWPGQFNLDFLGFLILSALWVSWRNGFSPLGLGLGLIAFFGGIGFLAPYLLFLSIRTRGDMATFFLGEARAAKA